MAQYTTKPQTVEAMQWLGPDDPAHVAEFEAWVEGCDPLATTETCNIDGIGIRAHRYTVVGRNAFCIWSEACFSVANFDFEDRYTPVTEGAKP